MSYYVLGAIASLCLLASLIPFVPVAHGAFRIFDFCRLQLVTISVIALVSVLAILSINWISLTLVGMLLLSVFIQIFYIIRFTPLWPCQSSRYQADVLKGGVISLFICNVKQSNRNYSDLFRLIKAHDPDIFVLMETDDQWVDALNSSFTEYEQKVSCPQDNSYGMYLASHLKMQKSEVRFMLNKKIPSFHCTFRLEGEYLFDLISLHPDPPLPYRDTLGRDAEILLAGEIAAKRERPLIVTGDLNDVAWSATTRRFLRISRLMDPRQGRGMFNSFDARFPFLRWPLDHVFHSEEFELVSIDRQSHIGSDHFPMFYRFALVFENDNSLPENPAPDDLEEADTLIGIEKSRARKPAGEEWES